MKTDKLNLSDLPPIHFQRSRRARQLNIRIKPYKGVVVSVPVGMSMAEAERFVQQKQDWIVRNLQKVKQFEAESVLYDGTQTLRTRLHSLSVQPRRLKTVTCRISKGTIQVCYPVEMPVTAPEVQAAIRAGLIAAYRKEAKEILPGRVTELALEYGFKYKRMFIKNHRSRWGSCSEKNNINLSLHLLRLPDYLIDYVILHELVHTEIKNHSLKFWQRLAEVCPQVEFLRKEIRKKSKELKPLH